MSNVKIQFDPNQNHQTEAVSSVIGLFEGLTGVDNSFKLGDEVTPNLPLYHSFEKNWLRDNLNAVQRHNSLPESLDLDLDSGYLVEGVSTDTWEYPAFTIEMETGTGKTYVYLKTILELKKKYGFRKFIIVVPSVAIFEGAITSFALTKEHFRSLYGNENVILQEYDGDKPGVLKSFATSTAVEILVMTIDSFNKRTNLIFKKTDKLMGERRPFEFLQETRPILILDESQNYRSEKARAALRTLSPLFAINYSATPVDKPNLVYRLTPVDAFRMNLVKKIEVLGMVEAQGTTRRDDFLKLDLIARKGKTLVASVRAIAYEKDALNEKMLDLKNNDNLATKTKNEKYKGFIVRDINLGEGFIEFENDYRLNLNDEHFAGIPREALFRRQIEETIKTHFEKQRQLLPNGVKVLTLFFIDRVANYVEEKGIIKKLFDESFAKLKKKEPHFTGLTPEEVRDGYFAKKKAAKKTVEEFVDTAIEQSNKTAEDREAEKQAYELIMRNKERLLSLDEKVCFIFAHSALREGWDNPNVFQICALREITSEKERRQSIGRGLRLPVNQLGERIYERNLNTLTVIANESYQNYVANLQREYEETGDVLPHVPDDAAKKETVLRNENLFGKKDFTNFWNKLIQKTEYSIKIDTAKFISKCVETLNTKHFPEPHIVITRGEYVSTEYRISLVERKGEEVRLKVEKRDTQGNSENHEKAFKKGGDLGKATNDPILKGFKIVEIRGQGNSTEVVFSETGGLTFETPISFSSEQGQSFQTRHEREKTTDLPKFNLMERVSKELSLTRDTVFRIFTKLDINVKHAFIKNPEGFSNIFIGTIREELADHIAERIEYTLTKELLTDSLDKYFPEEKKIPIKELVPGNDHALYDMIQFDSEIEKKFINTLNFDENVILYFKFPTIFKINIPKIIGNYNPDWGILRLDEDRKIKLELVRETKGKIDLNLLQHPNEQRKIGCAKKHFKSLGISYRHITAEVTDWWKEE